MAGFRDAHKKASGKAPQEEPDKAPPQIADYPELCAVLLGYESKPGVYEKGMGLTLYVREGRLKFSLNDKSGGLTGFGVVKGDSPLAKAIEEALEGEELEWKDMGNGRK